MIPTSFGCMSVAIVTASKNFSQKTVKKINGKLHFLTFIQPQWDYISSKHVLIEQIQILMCLRKNKYSIIITYLSVSMAAYGEWGIQVSETPILGILQSIMIFPAVSLLNCLYNNELQEDLKYHELKPIFWKLPPSDRNHGNK